MRQILKQTSWLILAQVLTKIIGFFYTIFLAKNLGVEDFGLYTVALAYFSIISSIADFGFNRYLIREVAKDRLKVHQLFCNIGIFRLTVSAVIFGIFAIVLYLFDQDKFRVSLILLAALAILPQSIALTLDGIFIALKKLQFSALAFLLASLANAIIGLFLINKEFGTVGAIDALLISQLIYGLSLFILFGLVQGLHFTKIELSIIKKAIIGGLPYSLIGILGLIYFRIDVIILSYIKGSFETGLYGAAYRSLEAIIFIPSSFAAALFPTLAKLHDNQHLEIKKIYLSSLKLMVLIGLVFSFGYLLILPIIIRLFLPNYLAAIPAIRILSLSLPFIFAATPGVQVLLSTEKYLKSVIGLSILTLIFNVILNLIFIPQFGFIAASVTTVLSDILSFVIFFLFIRYRILK